MVFIYHFFFQKRHPFRIPSQETKLVKSLPFYIPEAWKRCPFQAEPPRIGHYRKYPPPPGVINDFESSFLRILHAHIFYKSNTNLVKELMDALNRISSSVSLLWKISVNQHVKDYNIISPSYRFHVAVHPFSNRSQMMSKCVAHKGIAECATDPSFKEFI